MNNLQFDTGLKEYRVNGRATLRMNPGDMNLFDRFIRAKDRIEAIENELNTSLQSFPPESDPATRGAAALRCMAEADRKVKDVLNEVFGAGNDFDEIFDHVNVMAIAGNGERVITNFFAAVTPLVQQGAEGYAKNKAAAAKLNRAQRRAKA